MHVAVLGASFAGCFAAAAAVAAGHRATLVERDVLPSGPQPRRGVPQSEQGHVLLHRGLLAAERLLPGIGRDLASHGAYRERSGHLPWLSEYGWSVLGEHGRDLVSASRPLSEHLVRRRVLRLPGVEVREGHRVTGLERDGGSWRVLREGAAPLSADVVVDATGRSSRLPRWLEALGVPAAPVSEVDAGVGYATRRYRGPRGAGPGVVVLATPADGRGAVVGPVEDDGWLVTAVGVGDLRPPRDEEGFLDHLARVRDPAVLERVRHLAPAGDVVVHRRNANVRHHYGSGRDWPEGLLVLGDALCALNPVYGQGITVAACQALRLRTGLARDARRGTRALQRALARTADVPWAIATGQDLRFPATGGHRRRRDALVSGWAQEIAHLSACGDVRAAAVLHDTYHLVASPLAVLHPALLAAAARARLAGYPPATPRPAVLAEPGPRPVP